MGRGRELLQGLRNFEKGKIVTAREAVQLIHDGDTIATSGFVGIGFPENIAVALEQRFVESSEKEPDGVGKPEGLTSSTQRDRVTARSAASTISGTRVSFDA